MSRQKIKTKDFDSSTRTATDGKRQAARRAKGIVQNLHKQGVGRAPNPAAIAPGIGKQEVVAEIESDGRYKKLEVELASTKKELVGTKSELEDTKANLSATQEELAATKTELATTKTELMATKTDLSSSRRR